MAKRSDATLDPSARDDGLARHVVYAVALIVLTFGGTLAWGLLTEIRGAVIALGQIVAESNTKVVQHPDGGLVAEVLIEDKVVVEKGQPLLRLDSTILVTQLEIVEKNLDAQEARLARLSAERDDRDDVVLPERLAMRQGVADARLAVASEVDFMRARKTARTAKRAQIVERMAQAENRIEGLSEQRAALIRQRGINQSELESLQGLLDKRIVSTTRVYPLRKEIARLDGEIGELKADLAQAADWLSELKIQLIQLDDDFRTLILDEIRLTGSRVAELYEERVAAKERLRRIDVLSPDTGTIQELTVFAAGAVVAPGEPLMKVVPMADPLTVEARIKHVQIDQVAIGQSCFIRFTSLNRRRTPELHGRVVRVSGDVSKDPGSEQLFYTARIDIAPEELARLGDMRLSAGMPVEVFIQTDSRTPLSYVLKPLVDRFARSLREQ